jgi:hypothetical protein
MENVTAERHKLVTLRSRLTPDENILLVSRIRPPKIHTDATSFFAVIVFVRLFDEIRNLLILKRVREQSRDLNFPLDRKMTVRITEHRVLISKPGLGAGALTFLGDVPRARILRVHNPYVSSGKWKAVNLERQEGHSIQLFIDASSSEAPSRMLSPAT